MRKLKKKNSKNIQINLKRKNGGFDKHGNVFSKSQYIFYFGIVNVKKVKKESVAKALPHLNENPQSATASGDPHVNGDGGI